ncbi:MAG TPA: 4-(cytidine 5'-diphospho)-2-C-methyl-D-erythritol kinase [Reyranella sp.]|nr:4-(cytidine 5'-diphospho)-2-C-methyl-D-erythritol kinase [Reyranella sp.]
MRRRPTATSSRAAERGAGRAVRLAAHAKVNLWLNVVGRRADGYHLLDSLVAFADLADTLEAVPAERLTLEIDGPQAAGLVQEADNLVLKAARELAALARVPQQAALRLTKNIPMAAGLGGGSADAAAALRALLRLWRLDLPEDRLFEIAGRIGADVPMCLAGRTALAGGIGEKLRPAPALPACGLLLVNPGIGLPTAEVFKARRGPFSAPRDPERPWPDLPALVADLAARGNDLAEAAIGLRPVIGEVLAFLRKSQGVRHAAMTGSGATCLALYDTPAAARRVEPSVPAAWWRHAGRLVARTASA